MKTKRMGADNITFLIDKLGEECSPTQQLREFVQNGCEAIQRVQAEDPEYQGRIVIDFDPDWTKDYGAPKLAIIDNGDGMYAAELQRYMNNLSSSGSTQALDANYGVGAKIASLSLNPEGVIFESWKGGAGHMIHIWKDPDEGTYGLKPVCDADGVEDYVPELRDDAKPNIVTTHGTRVVLLGAHAEDNTCRAPAGEDAKDQWLIKTLNRRYFRFPENIDITARTSPWKAVASSSTPRKGVKGQEHMLTTCSVASGRVRLRGATAHWWLMPATPREWPQSQAAWSNHCETLGHVAVLVRNELYLHRTRASGRFVLQDFGITAGTSAVIIYVEPDQIAVNMARTHLNFEGGEPPWTIWGTQFREQMPKALADYVDALHQRADKSVDEEIRDRLSSLMDLFSPPRFRARSGGAALADPDTITAGGQPEPPTEPPPDPPPPPEPPPPNPLPPRPSRGQRGHKVSDRLKPKGMEADCVEPQAIPHVEWVTDDQLGDVAAEYLRAENQIRANKNFRFFQQIAERIALDFPNQPSAKAVIQRHIRSWFGTQLVEAVLGVQSLVSTNSDNWDQGTVDRMLKPEALTIAVCVRSLAVSMIRNACSKSLGRSVTEEAQAN
jgi:hypothetical protein